MWLLVGLTSGLLVLGIKAARAADPDGSERPVRVALLDFDTDDNSYRSIEAAKDFTAIVQARVSVEPGIHWVERAQLDLALQEMRLSEMEIAGGASRLARGKWAKADWIITGQFSLSDKTERTLFIEVTDVEHADVLASRKLTFPGPALPITGFKDPQLSLVLSALRELLPQARAAWEQSAARVLVAPLFFADLSQMQIGLTKNDLVQRAFFEVLDRAAATNDTLKLIRFPKAYQSLDESEMVLDGLVQANPDAWQKTADLYLWGTHGTTVVRGTNRNEQRHTMTLQAWDGSSEPLVLREDLTAAGVDEIKARLTWLVTTALFKAQKRAPEERLGSARKRIAESLVAVYNQMTHTNRFTPNFAQTDLLLDHVQILETACFFDPDNADAQLLRISCRWGGWIEFDSNVKYQFWTMWRRSLAWGHYVDRFVLRTPAIRSPPPDGMHSIGALYVRTLEDVLQLFPDTLEGDDFAIESAAKEAEFHGFPKAMPANVAVKWKTQVAAELALRKKRVAAAPAEVTARPVFPAPSRSADSNKVARAEVPPVKRPMRPSGPQPGPGDRSLSSTLVPTPAWVKLSNYRQWGAFGVQPPRVVVAETNPNLQGFNFPAHFDVRFVRQIGFYKGKTLVLAVDEKSSPWSATVTAAANEMLQKRGRIWVVDPTSHTLQLFQEQLLPSGVFAFAVVNDRLWVGGEGLGWLDESGPSFRKVGLDDGFTIASPRDLISAGGDLFAAGDTFALSGLNAGSTRWQDVGRPQASFSAGTFDPYLLAGNSEHLAYVAGRAVLQELASHKWTGLPAMPRLRCVSADSNAFWFGSEEGLFHYQPQSQALQSWLAPKGISGFSPMAFGFTYAGSDRVPSDLLKGLEERTTQWLTKLESGRHSHRGAATQVDPLALNSRIPGRIGALAQDGEHLWIGAGNYEGNLLCLHKPTLKLLACCKLDREITSLAVNEKELWIGTGYGDQHLFRIEKSRLLSAPGKSWLPVNLTPEDRGRIIAGLSRRDQAMYAFHAGDDQRVVEVLNGCNLQKDDIDQLVALALGYANAPGGSVEKANVVVEAIAARFPDSPWAAGAQQLVTGAPLRRKDREREQAWLARFDRNHDGVLDESERTVMERDPDYKREQKSLAPERTEAQLSEVLRRYDDNADGELNLAELSRLASAVKAYSQAPPEMLLGRKVLLQPLLNKRFPQPDAILRKYDVNKSGGIDLHELHTLAGPK